MLWALIRWVEAGEPPRSVVATKVVDGLPKLTRKLCPFPQVARYDGKGAQDSAASFACVVDPTLATR